MPLLSGWGAFLFFVLATVVFSWPLVTHLSDTLPDWGDGGDSVYRLSAIARQLRTDPLHLYQSTAFYPVSNALALNELMTGMGLLASPIIWLTGNAPLAYNLLNFSSFALSGFAMWLLVRHLTGSSAAGLGAGLVFAFSPAHYGQYGHLPLGAQQWMVFALYFLLRFTETKLFSRSNLLNLAGFVFFFFLQAIVAGYYAYFAAILIGLYLAYYFISRLIAYLKHKTPEAGKALLQQLGLIVLAGILALLLIIPFVLPFVQAKNEFGFKRDLTEISYWSAAPANLLRTTECSWLYNPIQKGIFNLQTSAERMMYPGLIATLLAIFGLASRRRGAGVRWLFGGVALTGLILSFGPNLNMEAYGLEPTGIPLPYKLLYQFVPGFDALRVAQRFSILFMLGLAVCAGYGVARLLQVGWNKKRVNQAIVVLAVMALVTADFIAPGLPAQYTGTGENAPPLYRWLASNEAAQVIPQNAPLLELPMTELKTGDPLYLFYGLEHGRPMLNGAGNIIPAGYERLFNEMQSFPSPATLDIIEGLGVSAVVVHPQGLAAQANRAELERQAAPGGRLELLKSFGDAAVYRVKPNPTRFDKLRALIPEGASVYLADHPNHRKLYNTALPNLLGSNRTYYTAATTIYDGLKEKLLPAVSGQTYDYAIFYRGNGGDPAALGYNPTGLLDSQTNDIIQIYKRK